MCYIDIVYTMNIKASNFLTKFTCIVHIHIGGIHFLLFALGTQVLQGRVLSLSYPAIKFIHFDLAELCDS